MRLSAAVAMLLASMAPGAVQGFAATGATSAALRQSGFVGGVAASSVESKVRIMHPTYSLFKMWIPWGVCVLRRCRWVDRGAQSLF